MHGLPVSLPDLQYWQLVPIVRVRLPIEQPMHNQLPFRLLRQRHFSAVPGVLLPLFQLQDMHIQQLQHLPGRLLPQHILNCSQFTVHKLMPSQDVL